MKSGKNPKSESPNTERSPKSEIRIRAAVEICMAGFGRIWSEGRAAEDGESRMEDGQRVRLRQAMADGRWQMANWHSGGSSLRDNARAAVWDKPRSKTVWTTVTGRPGEACICFHHGASMAQLAGRVLVRLEGFLQIYVRLEGFRVIFFRRGGTRMKN